MHYVAVIDVIEKSRERFTLAWSSTMKKLLAGALVMSAIATLAGVAQAATFAPSKGIPSLHDSLVTPVAGFICSREGRNWGYMRGDRRVSCRPSRPSGSYWSWRNENGRSGWWHSRERRWNDRD